MKFTEILKAENIRNAAIVSSSKRSFELIGEILAEQISLSPKQCCEALFNREKMGSTVIGNGIAMPHAKLLSGNDIIGVFIQLATPICSTSKDKKEIDLIFALLIPETCCEKCKEALPELAEKLKDKSLLKQLRSAKSKEEIYTIFEEYDVQHQQLSNNENTVIEDKQALSH